MMDNGKILEQGTYDELMQSEGALSKLVQEYTVTSEEKQEEEVQTKQQQTEATVDKESEKTDGKLIEDEERASGQISIGVLWHYTLQMGGPIAIIALLCLYVLTQCGIVASDWWIAQWSARTFSNLTDQQYLGIYGGLGGFGIVIIFMRDFVLFSLALIASYRLHKSMLSRIIRAPMSFFDTTPIGRVLSRFSKDQDLLDGMFMSVVSQFLNAFFQVLATFAIMAYASYWFLVAMVPIIVVYLVIVHVYRFTAREIKRLESISRSPLFAHFTESLNGIGTIRAYNVEAQFKEINQKKLDNHIRCTFVMYSGRRWLAARLDFFGSLLVAACGFFICAVRSSIPGSVAGLALSYALQVTAFMTWCVAQFSEAEGNLSSGKYFFVKDTNTISGTCGLLHKTSTKRSTKYPIE
jgi:ATP-binding cassette subfamily C (CFTR/MRP) protein 1